MDIKKNKEEFIELLCSTGRNGVDDTIESLDEMGFFTAPASAGLWSGSGITLVS